MARDESDANVADGDEEAFHWAGDEIEGRQGARLPDEKARDDKAGQSFEAGTQRADSQSSTLGTLLTGVFGAGYLALAVGWILSVQLTGSGSTDLLTEVLWQFGEFTAIVAAPLWFAGTLALTRDARHVLRAGWLALGIGLLLPWPLLPLVVNA